MSRFGILFFLVLGTRSGTVIGQSIAAKAYAYYSQKQLDSASISFRELLVADSSRADAHAMLSAIYAHQKRYDEAAQEAALAVAASPRSICYWTLQGNAHWGQGLADQAIRDYLTSLDVAASAPVQSSQSISVLRATLPYRQLEQRMMQLIAGDRATAPDYLLMGYALQMQSRFQESLTAYQKAITLQPELPDPYLFMSELYRAMRQPKQMVAAYEQAVEHDPFIRSQLYKAALQDYTESLRKNNGTFAYFALGYMHEKGLGTPVNLAEARKWYTYAEQMDSPVAAAKLTYLYEQSALPNATNDRRRIGRNREAGRRSHQVEFKLPNGNYQTATVYTETYPIDKDQPYAAENRRLQDVYGATVDLVKLLPAERPLETAVAAQTRPEPIQAETPLTASLMASPLLTPDVPARAAQQIQNGSGRAALFQKFDRQVVTYQAPYRTDSLAQLMEQTLTDYLGGVANSPILALQRLREDLLANRADNGFLNYAIGYIHEQLSGAGDWSTAEKWYMYAFQLHYTPAYQRLKHRYGDEVVSPVKLVRLEKNWQNGITEIPMTLTTPEGDQKTVSLYVMDNMGNSPEPMAGEVSRLYDLYGIQIPQPTVDRFNTLYQEARQSNVSFQDLCRRAFLNN